METCVKSIQNMIQEGLHTHWIRHCELRNCAFDHSLSGDDTNPWNASRLPWPRDGYSLGNIPIAHVGLKVLNLHCDVQRWIVRREWMTRDIQLK